MWQAGARKDGALCTWIRYSLICLRPLPHCLACFRYERIDGEDSDDPGGCILAHIMGLGKTLTTIAFLHTYMGMPAADLGARRVLVVVPANVLFNFYSEVGLAMTND